MSDSLQPHWLAHRAPLSMQFSMQEYWSGLPIPSSRRSSWPRDWTQISCIQTESLHLGIPGSSAGKESTCNKWDQGSIPGLGRSPGDGKGYPLQYSSLENSMGCIVQGVAKSWTRLSNFHSLFTIWATGEAQIQATFVQIRVCWTLSLFTAATLSEAINKLSPWGL